MVDSVGVDRRTGQVVTDWGHVVSCLEDLLTTRILSRVMVRQYGSDVPKLIDAPMVEESLLLLYAAIATACALWEPRIDISSITFSEATAEGRATLKLVVAYMPRGHLGDTTIASVQTVEFIGIGGGFRVIN